MIVVAEGRGSGMAKSCCAYGNSGGKSEDAGGGGCQRMDAGLYRHLVNVDKWKLLQSL